VTSAAALRDRITVERLEPDPDDAEAGSWVEHCTIWAQIEAQRSFQAGAERIRAGASDGQVPVRIHFRRSALTAAITTAMRIRQGAAAPYRYYNVTTPPQDLVGDNRILSVMAALNAPA